MKHDVELVNAGDGVRLRLRVKPRARADRLVGEHGGAVKLEVRAVAERGKANAAVLRLLAAELGLRSADLEITSGSTSQDKTVLIRGLEARQVAARLDRALSSRKQR